MSPALQRRLPLISTTAIWLLLFVVGGFLYDYFASPTTITNIFYSNASLGIVAIGMTLVIFSGGIDLSVGAVIGFTSIFMATLVQRHGWHPAAAGIVALVIGGLFGAWMGWLIEYFRLPPFLITLAGMFLARGGAFWISTDQIGIAHPWYRTVSSLRLPLGGNISLAFSALVFLAVFAAGYVIAHYTRFGRNLLAIGGNEQSALLMGLPVSASKIASYVVCSVCAVIAGIVQTIDSRGGNGAAGLGLELDAIAIVVIGGTLLTGGRGHMAGTLLGLLIYGTIQTGIEFDGHLNSAAVRIVIGVLLLAFILLQRALTARTRR
jgi:simple sugar transport system permease protein